MNRLLEYRRCNDYKLISKVVGAGLLAVAVAAVLAAGISYYRNERQNALHNADWVSMKANTSVSPTGGRV